jgi:hypothetical protein
MSIYVQRVKDPVANVDSAVDILSEYSKILSMELFLSFLQYFCYGYTAVTLSGVISLVVLSYWAEREDAKHQAKVSKLLTEDQE